MENTITEEELWMVHDYITFSNVSDVIDREVSKMDAAGFKFPAIIKGLYLQRQDLIFKEIVMLRVILTGRDIKIYEKNKVPSGVVYKIDCRMQEHTLFCLSEDLRKQSIMKLCELLEVDLMKCEVAIWQKN